MSCCGFAHRGIAPGGAPARKRTIPPRFADLGSRLAQSRDVQSHNSSPDRCKVTPAPAAACAAEPHSACRPISLRSALTACRSPWFRRKASRPHWPPAEARRASTPLYDSMRCPAARCGVINSIGGMRGYLNVWVCERLFMHRLPCPILSRFCERMGKHVPQLATTNSVRTAAPHPFAAFRGKNAQGCESTTLPLPCLIPYPVDKLGRACFSLGNFPKSSRCRRGTGWPDAYSCFDITMQWQSSPCFSGTEGWKSSEPVST